MERAQVGYRGRSLRDDGAPHRSSAFAAEHGDGALAHARSKLARKGLDAVIVNDISRTDIGLDAVLLMAAAVVDFRPAAPIEGNSPHSGVATTTICYKASASNMGAGSNQRTTHRRCGYLGSTPFCFRYR